MPRQKSAGAWPSLPHRERCRRIVPCRPDIPTLRPHASRSGYGEDGRLTVILLAGEDSAGGWLRSALREGVAIEELRRWLFAPRSTPPVAATAPRCVVCSCFDVSAGEIEQEIKAGKTLPEVQRKLKCGTSCGSCLTKIRRMLVQAAVNGQVLTLSSRPGNLQHLASRARHVT